MSDVDLVSPLATLQQSLVLARGPASTVKHQRGGPVPAWWTQMTQKQQRDYIATHPHSRFNAQALSQAKRQMSPAQKGGMKSFFSKLTGPQGTFTKLVNAKVNPKKVPPQAKAKIAAQMRKASKLHGRAAKHEWKKALTSTLGSFGLLAVGGAALVALGVPVGCFTPELVGHVWKHIHVGNHEHDDDWLIAQMCAAIKRQTARPASAGRLKRSMTAAAAHGKKPKSAAKKPAATTRPVPQPAQRRAKSPPPPPSAAGKGATP